MLQTENLTYQYKNSPILRFPDLSVEAGETLLICGDSGTGKTTLLHLLSGLRRPTGGTLKIAGHPAHQLSRSKMDQLRGKNIGIVYQQSHFIQALSIRANILASPYTKEREKLEEVAQRLGIQHLLNRLPHELSVGEQQRASIARAVMNSPKLLLADEPTSALDNRNCGEVLRLLQQEAAVNNTALLIVTHDFRLMDEVKKRIELTR